LRKDQKIVSEFAEGWEVNGGREVEWVQMGNSPSDSWDAMGDSEFPNMYSRLTPRQVSRMRRVRKLYHKINGLKN
jgi:hypothetical protein